MLRLCAGTIDRLLDAVGQVSRAIVGLTTTIVRCFVSEYRPSHVLAAENLFLRKQLALFQEREITPRRADAEHGIAELFNSRR